MSKRVLEKTNLKNYLTRESFLLHAKKELVYQGCVIIPQNFLPWTLAELKTLEMITSPEVLAYKRAEYGDTGERNPVSYFRILHPTIHETNLPECLKIIQTLRVKKFFLSLTGLPHYDIDRCQVHMYNKGDFIAIHNDNESCPEYKYTILLLLSDNYEGGDFIVYKDGSSYALKPEKYSMIVANSLFSHEVKEVTSGTRRTFVFFLKQSTD